MKLLAVKFILFLIAGVTQAEPIVIKDFGNTRPSGIPSAEDIRKLAKTMRVPTSELVNFDAYAFPVVSENMQVGKLAAPIKHGKTGINPFFVLGGDTASKEWVIKNKAYLEKVGITRGLITNVPSGDAFREMANAAKPLNLYLLNTDEIAEIFGVSVYPIVITKEEIQQ